MLAPRYGSGRVVRRTGSFGERRSASQPLPGRGGRVRRGRAGFGVRSAGGARIGQVDRNGRLSRVFGHPLAARRSRLGRGRLPLGWLAAPGQHQQRGGGGDRGQSDADHRTAPAIDTGVIACFWRRVCDRDQIWGRRINLTLQLTKLTLRPLFPTAPNPQNPAAFQRKPGGGAAHRK